MDAYMQHLENRCGCNDDGYFEDEPETEDRLQLALAAAYSQLYITTTSQIRAPYLGEPGLEKLEVL